MNKKIIKESASKLFFKIGFKQNLIFNNYILIKIGIKSKFHKLLKDKNINSSILKQAQKVDKKVLFLRMRFVPRALSTELSLAQIFKQKGWDPLFVACNSVLSICNGWDIRNEEEKNEKLTCNICEFNLNELSNIIPYPIKYIKQYLSKEEILEIYDSHNIDSIDELRNVTLYGYNLGDEIYLSLAKYMFKGSLGQEDITHAQRYIKSSAVLVRFFSKLISTEKPDLVIMNCGHIFWYGIAYKMLMSQNIKVITYDETNIAVTHLTWTFDSKNPTVDYNWHSEWEIYSKEELKSIEQNEINKLISERQSYFLYQKKNDTISFKSVYDISKYKYKFSLFTNVLWDATVVGKNDIYPNGLIEWVKHTITIIESCSDACLIIRIHPAEKKVYGMSSRECVLDEILKWKREFSENIIFVKSDEKINSYDIVENTDVTLIYATNLGLEAVLKNKMVIVTGPAHYKNKGFTFDPKSPEDYESLIRKIINSNYYKIPNINIAIKYAYFAYIKTQFKLNIFSEMHPHSVNDLNFNNFQELIKDENLSNLVNWMINHSNGYYINN